MSFEAEWKRFVRNGRRRQAKRSRLSRLLYYPDWFDNGTSAYRLAKVVAELFYWKGRSDELDFLSKRKA
jgi:hypothetical protein